MNNLPFICTRPSYPPSIEVLNMWLVNGDSTYVTNYQKPFNNFLALRTVSGCGEFFLKNGETVTLKANSLYIVFDTEIKGFRTVGNEWTLLCVNYKCNYNLLPEKCALNIKVSDTETEIFNNCFSTLSFHDEISDILVSSWFTSLNCLWKKELQILKIEHVKIIEESINFMLSNLKTDIPIPALALKFGISERYYRTLFKNYTKMTPCQFILDKRLNTAKELLRITDKPIKEIAFDLGFSDPYYFSRCFNEKYNTYPRDYRNSMLPQ